MSYKRYTDYHEIKTHKRKMSDCSYDDAHNETMTDSAIQVIDFDRVKTYYLNNRGLTEEKAHSVDVLANGSNQETYLIEFKNGNIKNEKNGINLKIRDSILILCDICNRKITDTSKDIIFVLVYNEEQSKLGWETKQYIRRSILSRTTVSFAGLDKIDGFIVKKVLMLEKNDFEKHLLPKLSSL